MAALETREPKITVELDSAVGPRVLVRGEIDEEQIEAALPDGLTVGDNWHNGVKLLSGEWSYPLVHATPLRDTLAAAIAAATKAQERFDDCDPDAIMPGTENGRLCDYLGQESSDADARVEVARKALRDSDEPRPFALTEEGQEYCADFEATSVAEALEEARSNVQRSNYDEAEGTIWIDVRVRCELTEEEDADSVQCDAEEPDCVGGEEHDWQSPIEIVGGIAENPGVWGHGGGVIIHAACMRCGCGRVTDTWAQRLDTGEQGLTSVSYREGEYAEKIARLDETLASEVGD